jgi:hypothetical protein
MSIFVVVACLWPTVGATSDFKIRGVLPWHNFLSGPSGWDMSDWRAYLDEVAAMNVNLLQLHAYQGVCVCVCVCVCVSLLVSDSTLICSHARGVCTHI